MIDRFGEMQSVQSREYSKKEAWMGAKDWALSALGASLLVANASLGRSQGLLPAVLSAALVPFVCVILNHGLVRISFPLFVIYGYALLLANDL